MIRWVINHHAVLYHIDHAMLRGQLELVQSVIDIRYYRGLELTILLSIYYSIIDRVSRILCIILLKNSNNMTMHGFKLRSPPSTGMYAEDARTGGGSVGRTAHYRLR